MSENNPYVEKTTSGFYVTKDRPVYNKEDFFCEPIKTINLDGGSCISITEIPELSDANYRVEILNSCSIKVYNKDEREKELVEKEKFHDKLTKWEQAYETVRELNSHLDIPNDITNFILNLKNENKILNSRIKNLEKILNKRGDWRTY